MNTLQQRTQTLHLLQSLKSHSKSLSTIKKRIQQIINNMFKDIEERLESHQLTIDVLTKRIEKGIRAVPKETVIESLSLNQGRMEMFENMVRSLLTVKFIDDGYFRKKDEGTKGKAGKGSELGKAELMGQVAGSIPFVADLHSEYVYEINWNDKSINLYNPSTKKAVTSEIQQVDIYPFSKIIHACNHLFITGGSLPKSNCKSSKIISIAIPQLHGKVVSHLLQPRSSHGTLYIHPHIYSVGGHKNNHTITSTCQRFNVVTKKSSFIASLNHCASALALCHFKGYIYKFGGVGEKFEASGLSPYIERWAVEVYQEEEWQGDWELINPGFSDSLHIQPFQLLSFCCASWVKDDTILIMGGYNAEKKQQSLGFSLTIDNQDQHTISGISEVFLQKAGGFYQNVPIYHDKKLYYLLNNDSNPTSGKLFMTFNGEKLKLYH